jgi:ABC-2 type transport system permease protein
VIGDVLTIIWKEWKEFFLPGGSVWGGAWSEALTILAAVGIVVALQVGPAWVTTGVALYWLWLPLLQMTGLIAESIAGERERHTLETLLASRLPAGAILLGKFCAAVGYGWGLALLSFVLGLATVNVAYGRASPLLVRPEAALSIAGLSLLAAGLVATVGILISARAPTVRQAYQRLSLALLVAFLPIFSSQYLPAGWQVPLVPIGEHSPRVVLGLAAALTVLDAGLLALALRRFRRPWLLQD